MKQAAEMVAKELKDRWLWYNIYIGSNVSVAEKIDFVELKFQVCEFIPH